MWPPHGLAHVGIAPMIPVQVGDKQPRSGSPYIDQPKKGSPCMDQPTHPQPQPTSLSGPECGCLTCGGLSPSGEVTPRNRDEEARAGTPRADGGRWRLSNHSCYPHPPLSNPRQKSAVPGVRDGRLFIRCGTGDSDVWNSVVLSSVRSRSCGTKI